MTQATLFSTFISPGEILDWRIRDDQPIRLALTEEAYGRWFNEDQGQAELYRNCWKGFIHVRPSGGYDVWIETEPSLVPCHEISIPIDAVQRCNELIGELRRIGEKESSLSVAEIPCLASLAERASDVQAGLADELISLLVDHGLASPLIEAVWDEEAKA